MPSPYRKTKVNGRTVQIHRMVWEQAHGPIPPGYIVHHVDHDKRNNDLSNLALMSRQEHSAHHNDKHPRVKTCEVCGTEYEPAPTKRARSKTCTYDCARVLMSRAAVAREASRRATHDRAV